MAQSAQFPELSFEAANLEEVENWVRWQPSYAALSFVPLPADSFRDSYLDTQDWAVYRGGFALFIRHQEDRTNVRMRRLRDASVDPELVQSLAECRAALDESAESVSGKTRRMTGGAAMHNFLEVDTSRRRFEIRENGSPLAVLGLYDSAVSNTVTHRLHRVHVCTIADGSLDRIRSLIDAMRKDCELVPTDESDFAAALRICEISPDQTLDFGYSLTEADASAGEYAFAVLRRHFCDFLMHEPGTRLDEDPEELHDMRVAARRLRSVIEIFGSVLPLRFSHFRDELRWFAARLGGVRDLDVRRAWLATVRARSEWRDDVALGPLVEDVDYHRRAALESLLSVMASERYATLLVDMAAALRSGDTAGAAAHTPVVEFASGVLRKQYRKFTRRGRDLEPVSETSAYHATRIAAKHLRYSVECFEPILPSPASSLAKTAKRAQDLLGEHQDCAVTTTWLRDLVTERGSELPPVSLVRIGELLEQQRARMVELRSDWPGIISDTKYHWSRAKKVLPSDKAKEPKGYAVAKLHVAPVQRPFARLRHLFRRDIQ